MTKVYKNTIRMGDSGVVTIAVGSKNPVKFNSSISGATKALRTATVIGEGFNVASGVPDQPMGDDETKLGAINRAKNAYEEFSKTKNGLPCLLFLERCLNCFNRSITKLCHWLGRRCICVKGQRNGMFRLDSCI